mmetsp:Transcript_30962/g.45915  ORF Transcript_30962/g.45915 Transcript_30962/m.45915 type:complete len:168 (-) Transcript_30962:55-558(-)|eukprot:CAMPEP_0194032802 /NCGR_PEP_ID=MMETSP0009_2-20130614/5665_1 /TAXON_ID=210454 /ORGANISM="Grammatophora oceanica, Strain CCMP 410" /LENGTH=167 /DNA_ID=CAMNT_0038673349 /DNA_START=151 /DNA_END=654 /DNA_ORIENTATION=+
MTHFSTISEIPPTQDTSLTHPLSRALPHQTKFSTPSSTCFDLSSSSQHVMASSATSPIIRAAPITRDELQRRKHFCIFLKILSHDLAKSNPLLHQKVKELVRYCTRKNRSKDPKFHNLLDSLMLRLRELVGEKQWQQCHLYTECYLLSTRKQATDSPASVKVAAGIF